MKRILVTAASFGLFTCVVLSSCERPALSEKENEVAPEAGFEAVEEVSSDPAAETPSAVEEGRTNGMILLLNDGEESGKDPAARVDSMLDGEEEDGIAEDEHPELRVYWQDGAIVIEGAIRSRIQQERIGAQLSEAFSGTRVENRLELDYDRFPVGWGNRIAEGFLIPYFYEIENAAVSYENGVITLKGYGSLDQANQFQHMAITQFSGLLSRDIDNQITSR